MVKFSCAILKANFMNQSSTSRYILTSLAIIIVITALALVALNAFQLEKRFSSGISANSTTEAYVQGFLAARKKYQALYPAPSPSSHLLSGVIRSVGTNSFVLTQTSLDTDPIVDGVSDDRTIVLTNNAALSIIAPKSSEQFSQELNAFQHASPNKTGANVPPSPTLRQSIKPSDMKVGQMVSIESDEEVRLLSTIHAKSVTVLP